MPATASVLVFAVVCLAACSKSEPPTQAKMNPPAPVIAPAPPPEPVEMPPPAVPKPTVELRIPGTPEAKTFIAANVVKQHKRRSANQVLAPETAYDKAYRNAARADKLLQRHAYVLSFDDVAATNAVPLSREYR
jgi:hypothetical protein